MRFFFFSVTKSYVRTGALLCDFFFAAIVGIHFADWRSRRLLRATPIVAVEPGLMPQSKLRVVTSNVKVVVKVSWRAGDERTSERCACGA